MWGVTLCAEEYRRVRRTMGAGSNFINCLAIGNSTQRICSYDFGLLEAIEQRQKNGSRMCPEGKRYTLASNVSGSAVERNVGRTETSRFYVTGANDFDLIAVQVRYRSGSIVTDLQVCLDWHFQSTLRSTGVRVAGNSDSFVGYFYRKTVHIAALFHRCF
uniref:Uncharacterized protein n=1 Tax=Anopheles culicifacies TaxID=139723 RepID=A0A182MFV4_9DIPT